MFGFGRTDSQTQPVGEVGEQQPDGTIYAGISPDTGKAMYTTPADAPLTLQWKDAMTYAKKLDAHGHHDFRLPSMNEMKVLYENRNKGKLAGIFNEIGAFPDGW